MGKAMVVTSGKGGVGKTTTTANLGSALSLEGKKVCLVDLDIGLRNLDVVLGLDNRIIYDIIDVVNGRASLSQALVKDKRFNNSLYLLPAGQNSDKNAINADQVREIINQLKQRFDYVIIDSPAGIEQGFINAIGGADEALIVTTPEVSAVRDADRVVGILEKRPLKSPSRLIINRIRPNMIKDGRMMDVDEITQHLGVGLLGIVVDDEKVIASSNKGNPIVMDPDDTASRGYRNISRRILGESVPLMSLNTSNPSMWGRIKNMFNRK